jgi:5-methylcytosine-specific restriction endonuclease McrA
MQTLEAVNVESLNRRVLVLNKNWQPHRVDTVRSALNLLFGEDGGEPKARIVDPFAQFQTYTWEDWSQLRPKSGEPVIHGVRELFRVPEVVLLNQYDKLFRRGVKFSRRMIHRRDNYTCQYFGCHPGSSELTIDHITPRSLGGLTTWTNCVVCCVECNQKKDNRTPRQARMKLLREPFKPKFELFKTDCQHIPKSWETWLKDHDAVVSEVYWNVTLENDND